MHGDNPTKPIPLPGSNLLLDIREFYEDRTTGQEKPGKKGITLSLEQVCLSNATNR